MNTLRKLRLKTNVYYQCFPVNSSPEKSSPTIQIVRGRIVRGRIVWKRIDPEITDSKSVEIFAKLQYQKATSKVIRNLMIL
jgi:hypothetical protein